MVRSLALITFFALSVVGMTAQTTDNVTNSAQPDRFSELVLDETTSEEAITLLGRPRGDELARLDVSRLSRWVDDRHRERIFRQLKFGRIGSLSAIELSFLENKLVMIDLEYRSNVSPPNLRSLFGVEFVVLGGLVSLPDAPSYPSQRFFPTAYPRSYTAIGISERTFILANCSTSVPESPGRVDRTRQISRALERRQ